jgi:hypothetical protein
MPGSVWPAKRAEPIPSDHRLAAMQPASWGRSLIRVGTSWLVAAAIALAGCSTNVSIPLPGAGPLVTIQMRGGLCPEAMCDNTVILERDGRVHSAAKPPNDLGHVTGEAMAALTTAMQATDWADLMSHPFKGECPIAFDGQELIFEFNLGTTTQRIASCEVDIDWGHPLFVAAGAALGEWIALPLT